MVPSVLSIPAQSSIWAKTDARGRRLDIERQLPADEQTLATVWRISVGSLPAAQQALQV